MRKRAAQSKTIAALLAMCAACCLIVAADAQANTLSGAVRYKDKVHSTADGSVSSTPMVVARYVSLDFVRSSALATVLGSTTTSATGTFTSPDIGAHTDIVVLIKATGTYESQTVVVRDQSDATGSIQTFQSGAFDLSGGNVASQTIDITADAISGAFNIYDQFIAAHIYIRTSFFSTPPTSAAFTVNVRWQDGEDGNVALADGTYYTTVGGVHTVNVLGDTSSDSDAFDDSVLIHEYGHLAAALYSNDDSPGGAHTIGDALDLRLAFSEGWADFFTCAVRGTRFYVDTNAGIPLIFEVATPQVTGAPGTATDGPENELAVSAILWDILNSTALTINNGAIDTPREALWDVFDNYLPSGGVSDVCLEDLWDGFFEGTVTSAYGSSPTNETAFIDIIKLADVRYYEDTQEEDNDDDDATFITTDGTTKSGTHYFDSNSNGIGSGDEDWFWFTAVNGTTYSIETLNLGNSADTVLALYREPGGTLSLLASNDDVSVSSRSSRIVYTATVGGKHYVRVTRSTQRLPDWGGSAGPRATYGHYDVKITEGATAGPTVVSITPANTATGIAITTTVVATFSQPVQLTTVTTSSFTVTAVTTPVTGTVSLDATRTIATFTPTTSLVNSTTYTVSLTAAIKDDSDRTLTAFISKFTTVAGGAVPATGVPRIPRAQIKSGDGYADVEWVYPTGTHDGVIVAWGSMRFPTLTTSTTDGTTTLVVRNGTELYRGNSDTRKQITLGNGGRAFVSIWVFIGTATSDPYRLTTRASDGGRGITTTLNTPDPDDPTPGGPTLAKPARVQAVSGDGYVDIEWVEATGTFDGVIIAVGSARFPKLQQTIVNGALALTVTGGTELYRNSDKVRFRLTTGNSAPRLFAVWTYKGTEFSRPLYAATRASDGGRGLTQRRSFYTTGYAEPAVLE
jgi:Big-like domain-containing protein/pre-peptidase